MLSLDTTLTFFAASVMLALVPGPDNVFVLLHSAAHGWRSGLLVVLGLCTGLLFHTAAVALGLAALMASSSFAFTALTLLGAVYLLWLAWQSWIAPVHSSDAISSLDNPVPDSILSTRQTYSRGVLMNITNPKVAIFFLAFLPQFVVANQGAVGLQILLLGGVFMLATLFTFGAIAFFAGRFGQVFQSSTVAQRSLNRLASLVFCALALRLLVTNV
jgi:threonine/homoserine/homoserine lactone efflux protein